MSTGREAVHGGFLTQVKGEVRSQLNLSIPLCKYILDRSTTSFSMARYGAFSNTAERNLLLQLLEGCFIALSGSGPLSLKQGAQFSKIAHSFLSLGT